MSVSISPSAYSIVKNHIKDGQLVLTSGAIKKAFEEDGDLTNAVVQLTNFKMADENGVPGTCARAKMFDGVHYYKYFFFSIDVISQLRNDKLVGKYDGENGGEILLITKAHFSLANKTKTGSAVFVIDEYELLSRGHQTMDVKGAEHQGTPEAIERFRKFTPSTELSVPWSGQVAQPAPSRQPPPVRINPPSRAPVPMRTNTGMSVNVTPITMITPYVNKWRIRGICTSIEGLKDISTKNGPSKVFNFVLTDSDGASIRIAGFGETASRVSQLVQKDCTYFLANGVVKVTNKRFNTTGHDYEITLRTDSEVTPCNDYIAPPTFSLKICPLDRLINHKDETVDVLAIVDKMEAVTDFTSRAGKAMTKREISLIDQSQTLVQFTLWNDQAREFEDAALNQAIGIKGASVKEWNGGISLSSVSGTKWELSPELTEVPALYEWYRDARPSVAVKSLAATASTGDSLSRDLRLIGTCTALQLGNEPDLPNGRYMSIKARVLSVRHENAIYQACSNEGCQKKVIQIDNQYRCEKCNTISDTFKWHYMASIEIGDSTGMIWVTAFAKVSEKIFGKTAQELGELKEYDVDVYNKALDEARSKTFMWRIRAKPETYNEEVRIRYTVYDVQDVNWDVVAKELEKALGALESSL